ncbi:MAG: hypothetical protein RSC73_02875 [Ruthenibacterium sp.]
MKRYYELDADMRIVSTSEIEYPQEGQNQFDFPPDFDFAHQNDYKIKGTVLSSDPIPQAPEPSAPTVEERLSAA